MKTLERTLSIVKPDAVEKAATGDIIHTLLHHNFRIVGMKMLHINKAQAEGFYAVHGHRPFFESLMSISVMPKDLRISKTGTPFPMNAAM